LLTRLVILEVEGIDATTVGMIEATAVIDAGRLQLGTPGEAGVSSVLGAVVGAVADAVVGQVAVAVAVSVTVGVGVPVGVGVGVGVTVTVTVAVGTLPVGIGTGMTVASLGSGTAGGFLVGLAEVVVVSVRLTWPGALLDLPLLDLLFFVLVLVGEPESPVVWVSVGTAAVGDWLGADSVAVLAVGVSEGAAV
jgi:hypothetical protein